MPTVPIPTLRAPYSVLLSIHDVMPHTLESVAELLEMLRKRNLAKVTLLVVPGRDWNDLQLEQLKQWQMDGYKLAGHGWVHQVEHRRTMYHKFHGVFLSRMVAEHLSLKESEIAQLIQRNAAWFENQGFGVPDLYVPPAWGMGRISRSRLRELPFRYYEHLNGVYDARTDQFHKLPVTGFEVDTFIREHTIRPIHNWLIRRSQYSHSQPLRISIHPHDHHLRMSKDLIFCLGRPLNPLEYTDLK